MKVTVLGCGNAFSAINYNQCFMLEEDGRTMLVDYGYQTPAALINAKISVTKIDDVYISHAHADHVGGLEQLAFLRYDWMNRPVHYTERKTPAPRLIANEVLIKALWAETLQGGLKSMEGFDATLETFFEPLPISPNGSFEWQGWTVKLIQQVHIMTGSIISPTFGLHMSKKGHKTIYFTTDSQQVRHPCLKRFSSPSSVV